MKKFICLAVTIFISVHAHGQEWDDPITISNWNQLWKSSFVQSNNATNAPESSGWFWGLNMNHSSNSSSYRYNGQIAIKNSSLSPTLYFRSTNVNGTGTWTKVIHTTGDQEINGNFKINGLLQGGFGASSTSGVTDWNDVSNSRSGSGQTLLLGNASNGPGIGNYFHPFNFEYYHKDGSGNITQLAIPYGDGNSIERGIHMRGRYSGQWSNWVRLISEDLNGNVGIATSNPSGSLSLGSWNVGSSGPVGTTSNHSGQLVISGLHNSGNNLSGIKLLIEGYDNDDTNYTYPIYVLDENNFTDFYLKSKSTENGLSEAYFQGRVGIGTTSPTDNLHISSGTDGDATLLLQADTDNNNEADNPLIMLRQDADQVGVNIGFEQNAFGDNRFGIARRYLNQTYWDTFIIDTGTGNIGIGTTSPDNKLDVKGTIRAEEVKVETGWADYVFAEDYNLRSLSEVSSYIEENHHLPGIPTAEEVEANGIKLGEMNAKLLEKIEELTLYLIAEKKRNDQLEERLETIEGILNSK